MANPAAEPIPEFAEFAPVPRLVVAERTPDGAMMKWEPEDEPAAWKHVP